VLLERPPVVQLLKQLPAFRGTRSLITMFTRALTGPYPEPDQSSPYDSILSLKHPFSLPSNPPRLPLWSSGQSSWLQIRRPGFESASELYRPSDRRLSAKWLPTFADRGCHVVRVTDPYGSILGFLDRSRYFSISSSSVVLTRLSGPRSRPTTFSFPGSAGNRTRATGSVAKNSDH
jgi:hypothetical protein